MSIIFDTGLTQREHIFSPSRNPILDEIAESQGGHATRTLHCVSLVADQSLLRKSCHRGKTRNLQYRLAIAGN